MPYSCWRWEGTETVDSSIRASAFAGLGALALSVIIAIFSGVPFGALALRALLSGLGFAALAYAALSVLRRFLPELFNDAAPSPDAALGARVDIVLPGGDEVAVETGGSLSVEPAVPTPTLDSGELQREVASLRSEALVPADTGEDVAVAPRPSVALDELDTLPDLDGFSDSFAQAGAGSSEFGDAGLGATGTEPDASRLMGPSSSMPTAGAPDAGNDPAVLAKAVQTLLRRDQKGQ